MVDEAAEAEEYSPRFIPGVELLEQFDGDNPSGEELTYTGIYDQLKEASRSDDPEVMGGDAFKPKGGWKIADWAEVARIARDALVGRSKDLRVASYLARALSEMHGMTGMREGLWLIVELQERFWDSLHPLPDKIRDRAGNKILDPVPRAQDVKSVLDHYALLVDELDSPEGDIDEEQIEKVLNRVHGLDTELSRLDALFEERYDGRGPSLSTLTDPLNRYARAFREAADALEAARREAVAEEERRKREEEERAAQAARKAEEESRRLEQEMAARQEQLRSIGLDSDNQPSNPGGAPSDRDDAMARLAYLAGWLHRADPGDPAAYRIPLAAVWARSVPGRLSVPPPQAAREALKHLVAERSWDTLLEGCRASLIQPWGRDWLDPVSYIAMALEELGDRGSRALAEVKEELRLRIERDPGLPEGRFDDGSPVASEDTLEWIESVMAEKAPQSAGGEIREAGLPAEVIAQADALIEAGKPGEALELLHATAATASGEREKSFMRLDLAEFCIERGLGKVADPIFRDLAVLIERNELEKWEGREFLARVYEGIYRRGTSGEEGSEQSRELTQKAFEKLCLMDPGRALRNK